MGKIIQMKVFKKRANQLSKLALILVNITLITFSVLFTIWYSNNFRTNNEKLMLENFCTTVDTMKKLSTRYLSDELEKATNWASYIEQQHMTMDEAMDYIRAISSKDECEAHFVDVDTFFAWTTRTRSDGSNTINIYRNFFTNHGPYRIEFMNRIKKILAGEKDVLGRYTLRETQRSVVSVGLSTKLRQPDGSDKNYLLLRVIPVNYMKELWIFPVNYPSAELGLIDTDCVYVIPSKSMRSQNFSELIRYYNYPDDYNAAGKLLEQLKTKKKGLLELKDSKGQLCYWYYSRLDEFGNLDMLGYIPVADLSATSESISLVFVVAGILLVLAFIDGIYILSINRKLRTTAEIAKNASTAKTRFLSSMSHDIRTPLNAVLGMTNLAQNHIDDIDYVKECLQKISLSGKHLLTLINDILEISRVESGRINLNPLPFNVRDLVVELESITRSQATSRGLSFEVQVKDLPNPNLLGDKLRLTQVYLNLLNNAVKYTNSGGSIYMEVSEEVLENEEILLIFIVKDTGIGMSEKFQKTMYDSFTRVQDSRIDKIQGTGLGLSIVKQMVTVMNGTIDCVSAEGAGTTFTVKIPLTASSESAIVKQETAENDQVICNDLTNIHILIAEDNDLNWEIVSEMLTDSGISCKRAENGKECVEILTLAPPNTYDLVFMDIQMPILNGRDATRKIRATGREDLKKLPIVAMTADAFAEDMQLCMDAGMNGHIAKPIEMDKVLIIIRRLLAKKIKDNKR